MMTPEQKKEYNRLHYAERAERLRSESRERQRTQREAGVVLPSWTPQRRRARLALNPPLKRTPQKQRRHSLIAKIRYATDPEVRAKKIASVKRWHDKNPMFNKRYRYMKKYGLPLEKFNEMMAAQGEKCAICGDGNKDNPNHFPHVDHCHRTNKVRGLVCRKCNHAIGLLKDDPKIARSLAAYLERA